ncbi:prolyl oligopeptidase family serine peptidase [Kitasatospora acidiphila]|uniref:Prolyl oligopeptidase family serine peptidase n=1 Tax=Kitasatospora acidiphila TaxID=2567942 RepID=A0A540W028_9ACTN|nr:prolyl oligopeptidase family serine peptidase [Kitasatospora acidiphila]TQF02372.1 prolyl oligopeptidase family serine peptidase [Kitasatospora acidiphila]
MSTTTSTTLPEQLIRTQRFTLGAPGQFTIAPDGATVLFVRSRGGADPVGCLWALDLEPAEGRDGVERLLVDPAELLGGAGEQLSEAERTRRERTRQFGRGITGYATDRAAALAVFTLSGELWTVDTATGAARRLPAEAPVVDPRPDPTGRRIAYLSGDTLRVIEADGTGDRAVAVPDGPAVSFGRPEHVAGESMDRHCGYWWAPDGERLLVARVDESMVALWYLADPARPELAPRAVRYPAAGTANAEVTLWLTELDGRRTEVRWDRAAFEYLTAAGWDAHGPFAAVQTRDQRTVRLLAIDPADGATAALDEQHDDCWVQLVGGLPARTAGGALLGFADRGDTRHLTVDGEPVTAPGLQLREVLSVDGDQVLFAASEEPTRVELWSWEPESGARRLTDEPGRHSGVRSGATLVHTARSLARPGSRTRVLRPGRPAVEIASHAEAPALALRVESAAVGPRGLRTQLFLPSWHREGDGPLPVLLDPYAGPALQKVVDDGAWWALVSQWFAEQGFAVLVTDGAGVSGRGPAWEREVYGDSVGPALDDQVAALHATAERRPGLLDLDRVGIRGWSFSGTLAAAAVLRRPDVFHAAVAGAGNHDQRLYDTHWRERFLGHPDEHPDWYDRSSLLLDAPKLRRPLLLVHGMVDDNVLAANTLRLSAALLAAGRPHEVLPLSGATHAVTSAELLGHQLAFLRRHL